MIIQNRGCFLPILLPDQHPKEILYPMSDYQQTYYPDVDLFSHVVRGHDSQYNPGRSTLLVGLGKGSQALMDAINEFIPRLFMEHPDTSHPSNQLEGHPLGDDPKFRQAFWNLKCNILARKGDPVNISVSHLESLYQHFPEMVSDLMIQNPQYSFPVPKPPGEKLLSLYKKIFPLAEHKTKPLEPEEVLSAIAEKRLNLLEGTLEVEPLF